MARRRRVTQSSIIFSYVIIITISAVIVIVIVIYVCRFSSFIYLVILLVIFIVTCFNFIFIFLTLAEFRRPVVANVGLHQGTRHGNRNKITSHRKKPEVHKNQRGTEARVLCILAAVY